MNPCRFKRINAKRTKLNRPEFELGLAIPLAVSIIFTQPALACTILLRKNFKARL